MGRILDLVSFLRCSQKNEEILLQFYYIFKLVHTISGDCEGVARSLIKQKIVAFGDDFLKLNWSERRDLNPRPFAPEANALPGCATLRHRVSSLVENGT